MTPIQHFRLGLRVLGRVFDVFVVWPSIAIGCLVFAAGLGGGVPIRGVVTAAYQWADDAFREAPRGAVLIESSVSTVGDSQGALPPLEDSPKRLKPIPVQDAIDAAVAVLTRIYWVCVLLGAGVMLAVLGPRRFACFPQSLPGQAAQ